jgi:O-antigen/teichoic acid export membrane protein
MNEAKKLISNTSIVFTGTIIGSFFAYLFNMLTGRMLGPVLYGEFTALLSLIAILSVAGGAVMTVTMKYASDLYAKDQILGIKKLYTKFSQYVLVFAFVLFVVCLIFIKPIESYFSLNKTLPIVIALSSFVFSFLIIVNRGILQGTQKFLPLSITGALEMFLRLILGVFLIKIGLSLSGAMAAVVISTAIVYFTTLLPLKKIFKQKSTESEEFIFNKKEIVKYTLPALISSILLMVALNIDIILVKHYFDPETAGIYAAISTIAKIVLYATGAIVGVMFPMISEKKSSGEKHYKLLLFSIILTVVGALIILGAYIIAPGTIIKILYGQKYVVFYPLLSKVGFFILLYALINVMANYYLAIKDFLFLYFFGAVIILQFVLIAANHSSLETVVKILIATSGLLFVLLFGYYLVTKKEQLISYLKGEYEQES